MTYLLSAHAQGTPGWFADRAGRATGSMADAVTAKGKTKGTEAVTRRNYRYQLACERLTGKPVMSDFTNRHMDRGREQEPMARKSYETAMGVSVQEVGFAYWADRLIGCSVDGLVGQDGFIEAKCPLPAIHVEYLERNRVPPAYVSQVTHNFVVTGAAFCDFITYCAELPPALQLGVVRVERAAAGIDEYEAALTAFLDEVEALTNHLREMTLKARRPLASLADSFEVMV